MNAFPCPILTNSEIDTRSSFRHAIGSDIIRPKNIAAAVSVEANELLERSLWHDNVDADQIKNDPELVTRFGKRLQIS
jgi:hypothetical protein